MGTRSGEIEDITPVQELHGGLDTTVRAGLLLCDEDARNLLRTIRTLREQSFQPIHILVTGENSLDIFVNDPEEVDSTIQQLKLKSQITVKSFLLQ